MFLVEFFTLSDLWGGRWFDRVPPDVRMGWFAPLAAKFRTIRASILLKDK
jgi:hypothetical protein